MTHLGPNGLWQRVRHRAMVEGAEQPIRHTFDVNLLDSDINHRNGKLPARAIAPFPPMYSYCSREKLEFHIPSAVA
jgi:hypothetical protein